MKRMVLLLIASLCIIAAVSGGAAAQESIPYLLRFPPGTEALIPQGAQHLFGEWWRAELSPHTVQGLSTYGVYAERDGIISVDAAPNDQYYLSPAPVSRGGAIRQWWLDKILAPDAWDLASGAGIKIAVVDSGWSPGHPDMPAVAIQYDLVENDGFAQDDHGHGTHVLGIIGARANNGIGIAGTAPGAQFGVWRVLGSDGTGAVSVAAQGIVSASTWANVVNLSLGTQTNYQVLQDAINTARANGAVTVCAAGNNGGNVDFYPALWCDLAVAAVDEQDRKADFSNYGFWWVDVAAPGVGILSTMPITATWLITRSGYYNEYDAMSGTSMAAPQVAAVVALALQAGRCNGPDSCRNLICGTADKISGTGTYWACGRVSAVAALQSQPQPTPTPWLPTPTPTPWANTPTPTPLPTPTPTPFSWPTPAVLPPWGITMSLPVLPTPIYDPGGNPVVGYSAAFMQQKAGVDGLLGGVVNALQQANSTLDDLEEYVGSSALGAEALAIVSGSVSLQASEVRGQNVDSLRGAGEEAMQAQVSVLSSLAGEPPSLREAATMIGISAAQPISYLRGWGMLMATADENPRGQVFVFISAMVGLVLLFLVLFVGIAVIRYILLPIASALWNLLRDIWEAIPFVG